MKKILELLLITLLAGHVPSIYAMDSLSDDEDNFYDAESSVSETSSTPIAGKRFFSGAIVPQRNNTGHNMAHIASFANGRGDVTHVGVNPETVSGIITTIADETTKGITAFGTTTEKTLTGFASTADQTMQIVNAGVDQLGNTGALTTRKIGDAAAQATAGIVGQVVIGAHQAGDILAQNLNGLDENGRAAVAEYSNAAQHLTNNVTRNAQTIIQTAGTQFNRGTSQIRSGAVALGTAITNSTQSYSQAMLASSQAIASAATPENLTALGNSEAGKTFAAQAAEPLARIANGAANFTQQGTKFLEQGTAIATAAAEQAPALFNSVKNSMNGFANLCNSMAGAAQGLTPTLIQMGKEHTGPLITEILEEAELFALPPAAKLNEQRKMLQLAATAFNDPTSMPRDNYQVLNTAKDAQQNQQLANDITLAQLRKIVIQRSKKLQQLSLTNGQEEQTDSVTIEEVDDDASETGPEPTDSVSVHQKNTLVAQLRQVGEQVPTTANTNQQPEAPVKRSFLGAPHPAFVFAAFVCAAGIVVVVRKIYIKWKKNKEKKEKRKQQKVGAQQETELVA